MIDFARFCGRQAMTLVGILASALMLFGCGGSADGGDAVAPRLMVAGEFQPSRAAVPASNCTDMSSTFSSVGGQCLRTETGPIQQAAKGAVKASAVAPTITPDELFDWAEKALPSYFPGPSTTIRTVGFLFRFYASTNTYVAVKDDGGVYVLFLNQDEQVKYVQQINAFTCLVKPTLATCAPVVTQANAGVAQSVVVGTVVVLDGSASSSSTGGALAYVWALVARPRGSAASLSSTTSVKPTFTADAPGDYVASLIVNDGRINSDAATVTITASVANARPIAHIGVTSNALEGTVVGLDGSASSDANSDTLTYEWTLTARPAGSSATLSSATSVTPTFAADVAGTYVVSLIVNDGKVSDTTTVSIVVSKRPPAVTDVPRKARVVAYVVTNDALALLGSLLVQFQDAVSTDTGSRPVTVIVTKDAQPLNVRQELQKVPDLWGAFLIGNIPALDEQLNWYGRDADTERRLTDLYYRQLNCPWPVAGVVTSQSKLRADPRCRNGIWVSRIVGGAPDRQQDIVSYVAKNLRLRVSDQWSHTAEHHTPYNIGPEFYTSMAKIYKDHPLYTPSQITHVNNVGRSAEQMKELIRKGMSSPMEMLTALVHGGPTVLTPVGDPWTSVTSISSAEVATWPLRAKFLEFTSCGPGGDFFRESGFFVGRALHAGETMLISATTVPLFENADIARFRSDTWRPLAFGASFAETHLLDETPYEFFGDPTIRLRPIPTGAVPVLSIDNLRHHGPAVINVSMPDSVARIPSYKEVVFRNTGKADLVLNFDIAVRNFGVDNAPLLCADDGGCGISNMYQKIFYIDDRRVLLNEQGTIVGRLTLKPDEMHIARFAFLPVDANFVRTGVTKYVYGNYNGFMNVFSNDPVTPLVRIEFTGLARE